MKSLLILLFALGSVSVMAHSLETIEQSLRSSTPISQNSLKPKKTYGCVLAEQKNNYKSKDAGEYLKIINSGSIVQAKVGDSYMQFTFEEHGLTALDEQRQIVLVLRQDKDQNIIGEYSTPKVLAGKFKGIDSFVSNEFTVLAFIKCK